MGGRDTGSLRAALTVAHVLLIPVQPRSFDVWALDQMAALVGEAREVNDGLRALAAGIETLDLMIVRRKAFPNAAAQGRGVVEQPHRDPKAVEELNALASAAFG